VAARQPPVRARPLRSRTRALRRIRQIRPDADRAARRRARPRKLSRRMARRPRRRLGDRSHSRLADAHSSDRKGAPPMTIRRFRLRAVLLAATVLATPLAISPMLPRPAHAQFGGIV